jgi:hypothetical protein
MEDFHPVPMDFQRMLRVGDHLANESTVVSVVAMVVANAIAKVLATQLVKVAIG